MDEFCPLCRKNGCSNKIRPVQLNFHEAVYLCESETCHWPYGYEEFKIIPRSIDEIGRKKSKKSNIKSLSQKTKHGTNVIPISSELSMYTPPVTPSNDSTSSKESVKGITPNLIPDDIFDSTSITTDHKKSVVYSGKNSRSSLENSYTSKNDPTSKTAIASTNIVKTENIPPKVPSIFDIDSSITLSTINSNHLQIETGKYCDIRNGDSKNNQSLTLMKSELQSNSTREHTSDQSESKFNEEVIILQEKALNGCKSSKDEVLDHMIKRKRPLFDDNNSHISKKQTPKKVQRVSSNQDSFIKEDKDTIGHLLNGSLLENCTPITSIGRTTGQTHIVNSCEGKNLNNPSQSKEGFMAVYSLDTSVNVIDNLNLDSFIDDNFLENCPSTTQDIDDEWLQSFLL